MRERDGEGDVIGSVAVLLADLVKEVDLHGAGGRLVVLGNKGELERVCMYVCVWLW